jgi:hypothetical protein
MISDEEVMSIVVEGISQLSAKINDDNRLTDALLSLAVSTVLDGDITDEEFKRYMDVGVKMAIALRGKQ